MTDMPNDLLARIRKRASDPNRRYMTAAEDQRRVELPIEEIERRVDEWHVKNAERSREAELRRGITPEEFDENVRRNRELSGQFGNAHKNARDLVRAQQRAWGIEPPKTMSFVEADGYIRASSDPPGAKPLATPPSDQHWEELERLTGRSIPHDLRRLYSISDGGFGPGFTGLNSVKSIKASRKDLLRRGPDYCGTIKYPESFLPIAEEMLNYHYDLDTGRIISSNQDWDNDPDDPKEVYDIAFQSLAEMMEDWLRRS